MSRVRATCGRGTAVTTTSAARPMAAGTRSRVPTAAAARFSPPRGRPARTVVSAAVSAIPIPAPRIPASDPTHHAAVVGPVSLRRKVVYASSTRPAAAGQRGPMRSPSRPASGSAAAVSTPVTSGGQASGPPPPSAWRSSDGASRKPAPRQATSTTRSVVAMAVVGSRSGSRSTSGSSAASSTTAKTARAAAPPRPRSTVGGEPQPQDAPPARARSTRGSPTAPLTSPARSPRRRPPVAERGSTTSEARAAARATGTCAAIGARQPGPAASQPPRSGPAAGSSSAPAAKTPTAAPRWRRGATRSRSASAVAGSSPAAVPCSARSATRLGRFGASAQSSEEAARASSPMRSSRSAPARSASRPLTVSDRARGIAYAAATQPPPAPKGACTAGTAAPTMPAPSRARPALTVSTVIAPAVTAAGATSDREREPRLASGWTPSRRLAGPVAAGRRQASVSTVPASLCHLTPFLTCVCPDRSQIRHPTVFLSSFATTPPRTRGPPVQAAAAGAGAPGRPPAIRR